MSPRFSAGFVPIAPLLIEGIGDEEKGEVAETDLAYRDLPGACRAASPTTVVIVTPHGPVFSDACTWRAGRPSRRLRTLWFLVLMGWPNDRDYVERAQTLAAARDAWRPVPGVGQPPAEHRPGPRDHAAPLDYLEKAGWRGKVVCVRIGGLSLPNAMRSARSWPWPPGKEVRPGGQRRPVPLPDPGRPLAL